MVQGLDFYFKQYADSYFKKRDKPTSKGGPNRAAQDLPEKKPSFRASQEVSLPERQSAAPTKKPVVKAAAPTKKPVVKAAVKKTVVSRGPSAGQKEVDRLMEKYNTPKGVDPKYIRGTPHK